MSLQRERPAPDPLPTWKRWLLPVVLAFLSACAFWLDMSVSHYFLGMPWGGDFFKMIMLCEAYGYAGTVAFVLLAAAMLDPRGWRVLPRLAIAAYGAGLLADLIKLPIGRHRPLDEKFIAETALQTFTTWGAHQHIHLTQSFPSAHTATATGLACGLAFTYPRGKCLFIALAVLTGLQRMLAREHYLSDVLAGATVGTLVGILVTSRLAANRWLDKLEEFRPPNPSNESVAGPRE